MLALTPLGGSAIFPSYVEDIALLTLGAGITQW